MQIKCEKSPDLSDFYFQQAIWVALALVPLSFRSRFALDTVVRI